MRSEIIFDKYTLFENGDSISHQVRMNGKVSKEKKKWTINKAGYLVSGFIVDDRKTIQYQHILLYRTFKGPIEKGLDVRHNDGNPANNALDNLILGTRKENMADKKRHGTFQANEKHNQWKLSNEEVREIREKFKPGYGMILAKEYKVCHQTIYSIINNKSRIL